VCLVAQDLLGEDVVSVDQMSESAEQHRAVAQPPFLEHNLGHKSSMDGSLSDVIDAVNSQVLDKTMYISLNGCI
jgi:hypothetical protein